MSVETNFASILQKSDHWICTNMYACAQKCPYFGPPTTGTSPKWTTYSNLKIWIDSWKQDLLKLRFANENKDGNIIIPEDQLASFFFNVDETGCEGDLQ